MSAYTNTVDVLGDEAVTDSFIARTLTEYIDSNVKTIGEMAFYAMPLKKVICSNATSLGGNVFSQCTTLEYVKLPAVTILGTSSSGMNAFNGCTGLKILDLGSVTSIAASGTSGPLQNCSALEALILRADSVCSLPNGVAYAFKNSSIVSGSCYIYVPRALVDTYKAASKWSTYANQIRAIEDYPEVCT